MGRLKIFGTAAAVALLAGSLAPSDAAAMLSSEARMTQSDLQITDGLGNKRSSDFFSGFSFTTDIDTTARLNSIPGSAADGNTVTVNKSGFETDSLADLNNDLTQAFPVSQDDGTSRAESDATTAGSLLNRGGGDPSPLPNGNIENTGFIELNEPNGGGTTSEIFTQVFSFTIADFIEDGEAVLDLNLDMFLETIRTGELIADSIGADASFTVTFQFGPEGARQTLDLLDLDSGDTFAGGASLLSGEIDTTNETVSESASFRLVPLTAGGDQLLFNGGDTGSITFRSNANTTAVARLEEQEIPTPATMMLFGTGLLGLGLTSMHRARRRRNAA